jgi:hypothetical protein
VIRVSQRVGLASSAEIPQAKGVDGLDFFQSDIFWGAPAMLVQ